MAIFEGSPTLFFRSILSDNIRFIAFEFTILLIIANMLILKRILIPFGEQQTHINIIEARKTFLIFDHRQACVDTIKAENNNNNNNGNDNDNNNQAAKEKLLKSSIEICEHLVVSMKQFNSAPNILGVELNDAELLAIRGYIVSVIVLFVGAVWKDYIDTYDDLLTN